MNILVRSILISFLVAIPAPFLIQWLVQSSRLNAGVVIFCVVYLLAFIACLVVAQASPTTKTRAKASARPAQRKVDDRETGTVKWFNRAKGFGFITRSTGEDVFVHYRSIEGRGRRSLAEGQKVRFSVVEGDKGLQAEDVSVEQ